jgi:transcriptional regulator with XRE-family HTH domain
MTIGEKIKKLRTLKGMTQEELGKHLGIGKAAVQKYESGKVENLKSSHIKTLCLLFNVEPWIFIFDDEEQPEEHENELYNQVKNIYGDLGLDNLILFQKLNSTGRKRVNQYLKDIVRIEEYIK